MDRILFNLGPFTVYTFGLSIVVGAAIAFLIANQEAKRTGLDHDQVFNLFVILLLAGVLGARIFFVLFYDPAYYWLHPIDIFKVYEGGLSIHGGIIGGTLAGLWYTRRVELPFWSVADMLAPAAILGQGIARVGCDIYGKIMTQPWPWGVVVNGQLVHPVQIYETLLDFALFLFLWGQRDRQKYSGQIFIYYLGGYASIRLILEFFRTNPVLIGNLTPAHITSFLFILFAFGLGKWRSKKGRQEEETKTVPAYWVGLRVWAAVAAFASASVIIYYALVP